jgi:hypothetical protein
MAQQTAPAPNPGAPEPMNPPPGRHRLDESPPPANQTPQNVDQRPFWRRPWMIPLWFMVAAALFFVWNRYASFNPALATVALPKAYPWKYTVLIIHIMSGSLGLITGSLQLWPWLRRNHPEFHKMIGRIYFFGGAFPAAITALILINLIYGPGGAGRWTLGILWLITSTAALVKARQGNWIEHRRYVIFAYALNLDAFTVRAYFWIVPKLLGPNVEASNYFWEIAGWCGWLTNLLVAYWWVQRTEPKLRATLRPRPDAIRAENEGLAVLAASATSAE